MKDATWNQGTVLVLGGTGKTGKRVSECLRASRRSVRIGSRAGVPPFDWEKPETWDAVLDGVSAAYVAYQPDLAMPGALETVSAFFDAAVRAGTGKLVLLSGRGEPEALDAEQALIESGVDWTILRSSWFSQNFSESFFLSAILADEVVLPHGLAPEPFVDVDDLAEIAASAFSDIRHSNKLYELTGPVAVSFADAIAEIGRAAGKKIDFIQVTPEEYRAELLRQQLPVSLVDGLMYLFTTVLDGRNTPIMPGVRDALGRAPRAFSDYVARTAATDVWRGVDA